jgi:hypothetical protein
LACFKLTTIPAFAVWDQETMKILSSTFQRRISAPPFISYSIN